jgi:hypothetical protein
MSTPDPLSLGEAKRLAATADTILLRATRPADLETPIGAFLRLDDGHPAYLLESVEGGERLGRYSFMGTGPRIIETSVMSAARPHIATAGRSTSAGSGGKGSSPRPGWSSSGMTSWK